MARKTKEITIVTPRDMDRAISALPAKVAKDFLRRVAHEMFVERDEEAEGVRYVLNDDKELGGADFIQEVRLHLEAAGIEPATVECSLCGSEVTAQQAHLHQGKYIGDCCWDERLKASE